MNGLKIAFTDCTLYFIDGMLMTFVLFSSLDHSEKFREYWSSKHPNISFLIEKKSDGHSYFLDISIFREKGKFVTNAAFSIWK